MCDLGATCAPDVQKAQAAEQLQQRQRGRRDARPGENQLLHPAHRPTLLLVGQRGACAVCFMIFCRTPGAACYPWAGSGVVGRWAVLLLEQRYGLGTPMIMPI